MNLAIVTGVTGFLGARLAKLLISNGYQVVGLKRTTSNLKQLDTCKITDQIELHNLDVAGAAFDLSAILGERKADALFHTAAISRSGESAPELAALVDANLKLPLQLAKTAKQAGVKAFINASTSWQSTTGLGYAPFNAYAATKEAFENLLVPFADQDFTCVSLRLFDTYGAGDTRNKIVDLLINAVTTGNALAMSPGEQSISLVHIDDIARAFLTAAQLALSGTITGHRVYSLPGNQPICLRDLASTIGELSGKKVSVIWGGRPYRPNEVMFPHASHPTLPTWHPAIPLDLGLKEMLGLAPDSKHSHPTNKE